MIKENDLFQLGNHRLLCGDSTQISSYTRVLGNNKMDLIITDPPYNVDFGNRNRIRNKLYGGNRVEKPILNDTNLNKSFFKRLFQCWKPFLEEINSIYICHVYTCIL